MRATERGCDVLHLSWSGAIGGIERQLETIVSAARQPGFRRHRVAMLDGRGVVGDALAADGLAYQLGFRRRFDLVRLWKVARLVRRLRPRILHVHTHMLGALTVALLARPGTARVYTEHSPRALERGLKFPVLYRLLRRTCSRFVALTPRLADAMAAHGIDPHRIVEIGNLPAVPPRTSPRSTPSGTPTVGFVGRLEPEKRLDLFVDVFAELRRRGVRCRALVVGDGSQRRELAHRADDQGVAADVTFVGEQQTVADWLDRFDVFFVTSPVETFGAAALEAMTRGVPVVGAACTGGIADLVARGGLLLPDRSVTTAAEALARVLASEGERAALRDRGSAVAAEHSVKRITAKLEALYDELDSKRPLEGDVVVVSPHLDDAAFSTGAAIASATRAGAAVRIVTVFAGDPAYEGPPGAWDRACRFRSAGEAVRARRNEDRRACGRLGAEPVWLPFSDDQYGPRASANDVWALLAPELERASTILIPGFPLTYPDHVWVTELVVARAPSPRRLVFYAEQPYAGARSPEPRLEALRAVGVPDPLRWDPVPAKLADRHAKGRACRAYRSQFRGRGGQHIPRHLLVPELSWTDEYLGRVATGALS